MKYFTFALVLFFFLSSSAFAHKDVGGGNTVDGTLLDTDVYSGLAALDNWDLIDLLQDQIGDRFDQIPFLRNLSIEFINKKKWYLDDRTFVAECSESSIVLQVEQEPAACQNRIEVRIKRKFWASASDQLRADLVFHEVFRGLRLQDGKNNTVIPATALVLDRSVSPLSLIMGLLDLGFPFFQLKEDVQVAQIEFTNLADRLCAVENEIQAYDFTLRYEDEVRSKISSPSLALLEQADLALVKRRGYGKASCAAFSKTPALRRAWLQDMMYKGWKKTTPEFFPEARF